MYHKGIYQSKDTAAKKLDITSRHGSRLVKKYAQHGSLHGATGAVNGTRCYFDAQLDLLEAAGRWLACVVVF